LIVMYGDTITGSMSRMMDETNRRREIQLAYNEEHGIVPTTVLKSHEQIMQGTIIANERYDAEGLATANRDEAGRSMIVADPVAKYLTDDQKRDLIANLRSEMFEASEKLEFERAAELRDSISQLQAELR